MPDPAGAIGRGRLLVDALMVDECTISRAGAAAPTYDPNTDTYTYPAVTVIYAGRCRVRPQGWQDRTAEAGEEIVTQRPMVVSVPMSATGIEVNDDVTINACQLDPDLVGSVQRVKGVARGTHITARRLACEALTT